MDFEILKFEKIDSTNKFAFELGKSGKRNIIIVSDVQTKGKGRMDRLWLSENGGLYFSVLMDISSVKTLEKINFLASISVVETLKSFSDKNFGIKWPNDVIYENKKICGILTELNVLEGYFVIGIGININNKIEDSIKDIGTSLYEIEAKTFDIREILQKFIENFNVNLNLNEENILEKYKKYSKTLFNEVNLILPKNQASGKVVEIDFDGIHIETERGIEVFTVGDCVHLR